MKHRTRILIDAKELIADESLWAQGSMETMDDPPRRCLSGAICAATGVDEIEIEDNPIIDDAIALVKSVIQQRYDGKRKLRAFMKLEDIEHCPPSDNDWLVGFNDYSRHDEVINEAIAASEPCSDCKDELTARTWHLLTLEGTDKVLCDQCSLFYG